MAEKPANADTGPEAFYCDTMLGRLARWLRLLGYDAAYDAEIGDWELLSRCRRESRILLTRDQSIIKRWQVGRGWVRTVLLKGDLLAEQVSELEAAVDLTAAMPRCPVCNRPLHGLDRDAAKEKVPPYVFQTQTEFQTCMTCGRVYWKATHWQEIEKVRRRLRKRC